MASIPRKTQKIFGGSLVANLNVAKFGSLAIGSPAYSLDLAQIQTAEWLNGWGAAVVGNNSPALQDFNAAFLVFAQQIAYVLQRGIPEWDVGTTYYANDFCRVGGVVYVSRTNTNIGNDPASSPTNWVSLEAPVGASTVGQSVPVDTNGHKIDLTSDFDPDSCFSTSTYTAKTAGYYRVSSYLQVDNSTGDAAHMELSIRVVKNAASIVLVSGVNVPSPTGGRWYPQVNGMVQLAANDTLEIQLAANDTVNTGAVAASNGNFSVERVRAS